MVSGIRSRSGRLSMTCQPACRTPAWKGLLMTVAVSPAWMARPCSSRVLPGEEVGFRYLRRRREYDEAQVLEIHRASPHRVEPRCSHFATCGGCTMQHLMPTAQLAVKQQALLDNLRRIGHVQPVEVLPPLTAPVWGYRRRARLSVRHVPVEGRVLIGFVGKTPPMSLTRAVARRWTPG